MAGLLLHFLQHSHILESVRIYELVNMEINIKSVMKNKNMKITIFTEGTILMHESAIGHSRDEIVRQVINHYPAVKNYATYIPVANAAGKIQKWADQSAQVAYITSRREQKEIDEIQNVLDRNGFPKGPLEYRKANEEYKDVAERIMPDILIEDDCESIGGEKEMTYPHIKSEIKVMIKSIIVKEFGGIDYLPDDIGLLRTQK